MYKPKIAARILKISYSKLYAYHKKYNIGTLKSPKHLYYSDDDIAFVRKRLEEKKGKELEKSEYEKAIQHEKKELITRKELAQILGVADTFISLLVGYAVEVPAKTTRVKPKYKHYMFRRDDIPEIKAALRGMGRQRGRANYNKGAEHSAEYLEAIKQKYAAGVPDGEVEKWILGN